MVAQQALREAIITAVDNFGKDAEFQVITDIHLVLDTDTGTLTICDDNDTCIASTTVEDWADADGGELTTLVIEPLRELLRQMDGEHLFARPALSKPFTFVLEDSEHETIEELYFVDDDNIILTQDLLSGLDQELDDFLQELMK